MIVCRRDSINTKVFENNINEESLEMYNKSNISVELRTKNNLKCLSYNVCGIRKQGSSFFHMINEFDVFALFETHMENFDVSLDKYFEEYSYISERAVKYNSKGRASGGILIGFRKELSNMLTFGKVDNLNVINLFCRPQESLIILPVYLNCNHWERDFNRLYDCMSSLDTNQVIILGDLNCRTSNRESCLGFMNNSRRSEDNILNNEGTRMLDLCNDFGLTILNGCTESDREGRCTFIGGQGKSVIDYCIAGVGSCQYVSDMEIFSQTFSDHLPLKIDIKIEGYFKMGSKSTEKRLKWNEKRILKYHAEIEKAYHNVKNSPTLEDIDTIIKDCASITNGNQSSTNVIKFKEIWFDFECLRARNKKLVLLNKWRKTKNSEDLLQYKNCSNEFKLLVKIKKEDIINRNVSKLCTANNSSEFWKAAKDIAGNNSRSTLIAIDVNVLKNHFDNLLNPRIEQIMFSTAFPDVRIDCLDMDITLDELMKAMDRSACNKAPGPNGIPIEFYKNLTNNMKIAILNAFNKIYEEGIIPESYLKAIIFPIFKKGDKNEPSNYRGISFQNSALKLFTSILHERLLSFIEENNVLSEFQAGFRKSYSTIDQIFNLLNIANMRITRKEKLYAFYVDFRTAFDQVQRQMLFYKLSHLGLSSKFLKILQALYVNTTVCVSNGKENSNYFQTNFGIKQGCNISPTLFSLFIDDIHKYLLVGVEVGELKVNVLMYADDLVLLAKSADSLRVMISRLEQYCDISGLTVNLDKSKIMIFRNGTGKYAANERWYYKKKEIEIVREYTYLGFLVTSNLNFEKHLKRKAGEAKAALAVTWKRCIQNNLVSASTKYRIFQSTALMTLLYASPCFGFKYFDVAESVQRYFLKRSLGCHRTRQIIC